MIVSIVRSWHGTKYTLNATTRQITAEVTAANKRFLAQKPRRRLETARSALPIEPGLDPVRFTRAFCWDRFPPDNGHVTRYNAILSADSATALQV